MKQPTLLSLLALSAITAVLSACGSTPVPSAQLPASQSSSTAETALKPGQPSGAAKTPALQPLRCLPDMPVAEGLRAQVVCQPIPDPDPDPQPPVVTTPSPPASAALFGPKPTVVAADILARVGLTNATSLFEEHWQPLCEIHIWAEEGTAWRDPEAIEKQCSGSPIGGTTLVQVRVVNYSARRCSFSTNLLRAGTDFKIIDEMDEKYKQALEEIKLSVQWDENQKAELSAKLGEMHRYHKSVLEATSKLDVGALWSRAVGDTWYGGRGWCDLVLEGLVMKV
jgi:hypothetical protein